MFGLPLVALLFCGSLSQETEAVRDTETVRGAQGGTVYLKCGSRDVTWLKNDAGELKDIKTLG